MSPHYLTFLINNSAKILIFLLQIKLLPIDNYILNFKSRY